MKNKKLIATVASLCLIVVAVVAAVVGVLAAAQQQANAKIKVSYEAKANVYATVSLNGKTEQSAYGTAVSKTFNAADTTSSDTVLEFRTGDNALALSETSAGTDKYALYQFTFENKNDTHALEVTMNYTQGTAGTNVKLFWVRSSEADYAPTLAYSTAGALTTTSLDSELSVTSGTDVKVYNHTNTTPNQIAKDGTGDTQYIYLVVAVINLNNDASYELDNTSNILHFTLDGYRAA